MRRTGDAPAEQGARDATGTSRSGDLTDPQSAFGAPSEEAHSRGSRDRRRRRRRRHGAGRRGRPARLLAALRTPARCAPGATGSGRLRCSGWWRSHGRRPRADARRDRHRPRRAGLQVRRSRTLLCGSRAAGRRRGLAPDRVHLRGLPPFADRNHVAPCRRRRVARCAILPRNGGGLPGPFPAHREEAAF